MTDEKFLDQKMDRREFLKKAGIGGAGLALGLSGASAFFNNQDSSSKKAYDGDEDIAYIPATFVCFVLGLAFGYYFVSPAILEVLLKLGEGLFNTQITAQNYLIFLLHTTVPLAVLFELPVVVSFLTSIGIITPVFLTRYRRYAYFVLLVLAVVLTPADFISDLAMTAPLILLYEVSVTLSKLIYKRKQRKYKDK